MKLKLIPGLVICGGILFTLYLQGQVADGVYFSGDGGLKALLAKQLGAGIFRFDLAIPDIPWVRDLWQSGLYPYEEPYVYRVAEKYFITFPYTFPLVTAGFYALFGYRGLYIIPLVSCWLVWLIFYTACQKLKLGDWLTAFGLLSLIFASFVTIYSAMYWEHTLAVALALGGLYLWFFREKKVNNLQVIISGFLIGFAVWFRPEFICVVVIMTGLAIIDLTAGWWQNFIPLDKEKLQLILFSRSQQLLFLFSTFLTVGSFFLTNKLIYGYAVGIHGIQVVEPIALSDRLLGAWRNFSGMSLALVEFLPIIIVPILLAGFYLIQNLFFKKTRSTKFNSLWLINYLAILAFIIGVSLLVPVGTAGLISGGKQWGVRFLLILVPIIILLTTVQLQTIINKPTWKYIAIALLTILTAIGIYKNTIQASQILTKNNFSTYPALEYLQQDDNKYIAISHEFVGQSLEAGTSDREIFFTIDTLVELIQFSQTLVEQNKNEFTYICYPHRACDLPKFQSQNLQFKEQNKIYEIQFNPQGKQGKYPIYQVIIQLKTHNKELK